MPKDERRGTESRPGALVPRGSVGLSRHVTTNGDAPERQLDDTPLPSSGSPAGLLTSATRCQPPKRRPPSQAPAPAPTLPGHTPLDEPLVSQHQSASNRAARSPISPAVRTPAQLLGLRCVAARRSAHLHTPAYHQRATADAILSPSPLAATLRTRTPPPNVTPPNPLAPPSYGPVPPFAPRRHQNGDL